MAALHLYSCLTVCSGLHDFKFICVVHTLLTIDSHCWVTTGDPTQPEFEEKTETSTQF